MRNYSAYEGQVIVAKNPKSKHLTHGKSYTVAWVSIGGYAAVKNDGGRIKAYHSDNFEPKEEA